MAAGSLEQVLQSSGNPVEMLRNSKMDAFVYPVVATEFSNWRSEQRAWRESVVLFDQSHHMAELLVQGRDAAKLLSRLAVNSFEGFTVDKAKQFVGCNYSGHVIGDSIMFYLAPDEILLVGRPPSINWIEFHAHTGGYEVEAQRDNNSPARPNGRAVVRKRYRYQIQGPLAPKLLEKLNGGPLPDIKFFNMGRIKIAGKEVRALRHGMSGVPGLEFWGPYEEREQIRDAVLAAGEEFGLHQVGSRAYSTSTLESGWIPSPLPAVYTDERMRPYREWLPGNSYEATGPIGGSFVSDRIEDYYLTPYELGYGPFVKLDHDFIGRESLQAMSGEPHRRKVSFAWNSEDVARIQRSFLDPEAENFKYIEMPLSNYAASNYDRVERRGKQVGFSMFSGYSYNERTFLSLGTVDPDVQLGEELTLIWGEENSGTRKSTVEPHRQSAIRVQVAPVPFSSVARHQYARSWRTAAAV